MNWKPGIAHFCVTAYGCYTVCKPVFQFIMQWIENIWQLFPLYIYYIYIYIYIYIIYISNNGIPTTLHVHSIYYSYARPNTDIYVDMPNNIQPMFSYTSFRADVDRRRSSKFNNTGLAIMNASLGQIRSSQKVYRSKCNNMGSRNKCLQRENPYTSNT
jgi:hypothetical protein